MTAATDVVSLADMKAHLRYPAAPGPDGAASTDMIGAAVDVLSYHCADILPTTYRETYNGGDCSIWLRHKPVLSVDQVIDNSGFIAYDLDLVDTTQAATINSTGSEGGTPAAKIWAFTLDDPETGQITKRTIALAPVPFSCGIRNVTITYRAGRSAPYPPAIVMAVMSLGAHWWQNESLRSVAQGGANVAYDATTGDVIASRRDGVISVVAGIPNRILELVLAHRRDPVWA